MKKRYILRDQAIRENALWEIRNLPDDTVWEVGIKKYVKPRSKKQHGYYRVLLDLCSEHTGYEKDELHDMMRTIAGLWKTINGIEILMSNNEMSVIQMQALIDVTLRTAAQDMELTLPEPTYAIPERC